MTFTVKGRKQTHGSTDNVTNSGLENMRSFTKRYLNFM